MNETSYTLEDVYNSEILAASWMGVALILLTSALLFYHMTRVSSLEMNSTMAGVFAIILMILSMVLCIMAVHNYRVRIKRYLKTNQHKKEFEQENRLSTLIIIFGIALSIVEVGICITIIMGTFKSSHNTKKTSLL